MGKLVVMVTIIVVVCGGVWWGSEGQLAGGEVPLEGHVMLELEVMIVVVQE